VSTQNNPIKIAVVIPSYKVTKHILSVIDSLDQSISLIYVVDDCCPDKSGEFVKEKRNDTRIKVLKHSKNQGVGGAVLTGYNAALSDGADIIIKIDGDGQMDANQIPKMIQPILDGEADYTKGNRFFNLEEINAMPKMRLFGNAVLSMMTKFSSGYWDLFDPANGFTAIHKNTAKFLPSHKISKRYFFETDMLFRLNTLRAVVVDVPMEAKYGDEISNLKIHKIIGEFLLKHAINLSKRIFYNYYLRDMSLASIELPIGLILFFFGLIFGTTKWVSSSQSGIATTAGTVMIACLPLLMGLQLILAFLAYDISMVPRRPISKGP